MSRTVEIAQRLRLHEFLRTRRSTRRFRETPVEDDVLERILTTATFAPSAHNRQPWRFVVVRTPEARSRLATSMAESYRHDLVEDNLAVDEVEVRVQRSVLRIKQAPLLLVLCMDASEMDQYPDARRSDAERTMALQSAANAGMLLMLAAHAEGLGAVWNCAPLFAQERVRTALELPLAWEPQGMLLGGAPLTVPAARPRKLLESISRFL